MTCRTADIPRYLDSCCHFIHFCPLLHNSCNKRFNCCNSTVVLQIKWRQGGAGESGRQLSAPAGLTEILPDPVEQQRVGVSGSCRPVEVNDAAAVDGTKWSLPDAHMGARVQSDYSSLVQIFSLESLFRVQRRGRKE